MLITFRGRSFHFLSRALAFTTVLVAGSIASSEIELYSQAMFRPEIRQDRPSGTFQETRLRYSSGLFNDPIFPLALDAGAYFLSEWVRDADVNAVLSPYLGLHVPYRTVVGASVFSLTAFFEGRQRQAMSDLARATGQGGWDPRTGFAVGVWSDLGDVLFVPRGFLDVYGDVVLAPRFASSPMGTFIGRFGSRFLTADPEAWVLSLDGFAEIFHQDAASLDLGTRRTEARIGTAGSINLKPVGVKDGSLQLRVYEGWPLRSELEKRPRFEGLLVLGVTL